MRWKVIEGPTSFYVILRHPRVVWSIHEVRDIWTIMERSGVFWIMVQGEKKWKKVNKVHNTPYGGHDNETVPDCSKNCSISQGTDKDHSKDYTLVFWVIYIMLRCVLTHWLFSVITLWTIHLCLMDYWVAWAIPPYCGGPFIRTGPLSHTVTPCHHPILEGPYDFWNVVSHRF